MKGAKFLAEFIIILIALGAALYTQRVAVLDWYQEVTAPELPAAVAYEDVLEEEAVERSDTSPVIASPEGEAIFEDEEIASSSPEDLETPRDDGETEIIEELELDEELETDALDESSVVIDDNGPEEIVLPASINLAVPFTPQAPHANWDYPYKEACEEASVYMVYRYYEGEPEGLINADKADKEILNIVEFEQGLFGYYEDTTVEQTGIFAELMFGYSGIQMIENPTIDDIKKYLAEGKPVIVPAAGRLLGNPYFTAPGPLYHMLVIRGYTQDDQFIVNDPGTYRGEAYLYDFDTLMNAMHDWNNGGEITEGTKVILVIYP